MSAYTPHHSLSLVDKVILISGAYGLIGQTIALSFLEQGAYVILADIDHNKQEYLAWELNPRFDPSRYLLHTLDISKEGSCVQVIEATAQSFGRLDVLINCAALDAKFDAAHRDLVNSHPFEDYPAELIRSSLEVNVTGTILLTQCACRQMVKQQYGNIIQVASTYSAVAPNQCLYETGEKPFRYKPVDYVASKSFIPNFTRYVATFYAGQNIRCNAIAPHGIENQHSSRFQQNFARLSPLRRMCRKEELIGPFTFLASDASSYMTGSVLTVDGGWTAW